MKKTHKTFVAGIVLAVSAGVAVAQSIGKPTDKIRWRQSAYQTLAWSMGRIKTNVEGQFNKDQVVQAANVIAAIANSGIGTLFTPDTKDGKGWKQTEVKPELFTDHEGVGKVAKNFNQAANEMAKAAASGDQLAVTDAFDNLGKACKGCHEKFRKED